MEHFSMFRENTHNLRNFQIILNKTNKQTNKSKMCGYVDRRQYLIETLSSGKISQRNTNSQISLSELKSKTKTWK